jgi:20S proteasome alpha/beta subunit
MGKGNNEVPEADDCGFIFAIEERGANLNSGGSGPAMESHRFLRVGKSAFILCSGLQSDVIRLREELQKHLLDIACIDIDAMGVSKVLSNLLYKNRMYVSPIVAGFVGGAPYIASMDSRGALVQSVEYAATGAVKDPLMNMCETLYRGDMGLDAAADLATRCFDGALARDVGSAGGAEQQRRPRIFALQHGILWAQNRSHNNK